MKKTNQSLLGPSRSAAVGKPRKRASGRERHIRLLNSGADGIVVLVDWDTDILTSRRKGWELAKELGFSSADATLIATVISELARDIFLSGQRGELVLRRLDEGSRLGIAVIARSYGPDEVWSVGLDAIGVKRVVDEVEFSSAGRRGASVTVRKWKR